MSLAPFKKFYITSKPKWIDKGNIPIAEVTENLPPTQSQNPNTFVIPKFEVSFKLVLHAHIWESIILPQTLIGGADTILRFLVVITG